MALSLLNHSVTNGPEQAAGLSKPFGKIVDSSVQAENSNQLNEFPEGAEFWNAKLMNSISGHFERIDYEDQWDDVVDGQ